MSRKQVFIVGTLMFLLIAVFYLSLTIINATVFWNPNEVIMRVFQTIAMILSGVITYFIAGPIIGKKYNYDLYFVHTIIAAVIVASIFKTVVRAFDGDFSVAYTLLIIGAIYLLFKEELIMEIKESWNK